MAKAKQASIKQASIFEDDSALLPLLSGVPMRVDAPSPFAPKAVAKQERIAVNCTACMDTGRIGDKRCFCRAGQEA